MNDTHTDNVKNHRVEHRLSLEFYSLDI